MVYVCIHTYRSGACALVWDNGGPGNAQLQEGTLGEPLRKHQSTPITCQSVSLASRSSTCHAYV